MDSKPPPFAGGRPRPPTTAGARHASRSLDDFLHRVQHSAIYSSPHHHWPRKPSRTRREFRLAALELLNPSRADKFLQAVSEGNLPKVVAYLFPSLGGHHPHTLAESHLLRSTPLSSSPSSSSSSASPSFSTRPTSLGLPKFEELALDGSSLPGPSSPAPGPPFDVHSPQYLANVTDASQRSGLHIAASKGNVAILILLIRAGASVNTRDVLGNTPLHIAVVSNHINCVLALLQAGAEISACNFSHNAATPLDLARNRLRSIRIHERDALGHWESQARDDSMPVDPDSLPPSPTAWPRSRQSFGQVVTSVRQIVQILQHYTSQGATGDSSLPGPSQSLVVYQPLAESTPPSPTLHLAYPDDLSPHRRYQQTNQELDQLLGQLARLDLSQTTPPADAATATAITPTQASEPTVVRPFEGPTGSPPAGGVVILHQTPTAPLTPVEYDREMNHILDRLEKLFGDI